MQAQLKGHAMKFVHGHKLEFHATMNMNSTRAFPTCILVELLVKISFTEALLVVLECTDAIVHSKVERALALPCLARTHLPA